ncbi:MAG: hypothetical protein C4532_14175 [Candidatus Abyssobacteria bacterium SURF_17]|uniref:Uncharacterized protein n=1 Tax=Candidatus Abyssobacteria bacterium SURF_17 TaxID=2093361 RepID=A0A419EUA2_9BACT|nr:MAG: hypothetical protein C4532_14175 [Candidatus Abyssubacteria bacterium SURF_17]
MFGFSSLLTPWGYFDISETANKAYSLTGRKFVQTSNEPLTASRVKSSHEHAMTLTFVPIV